MLKVFLGACVGCLLCVEAVKAEVKYNVTLLGDIGKNLSGYSTGSGLSINSTAAVAGHSEKYSQNTDLGIRATRWNANSTTAVELGNLGLSSQSFTQTEAIAINDSGVAVGDAYKWVSGVSMGPRAVRWNAGSTTPVELGTFGARTNGFSENYASGIDNAGNIVGVAHRYSGSTDLGGRPVKWNNGSSTPVELNTLGPKSTGEVRGAANTLNNNGMIVGYSELFSGNSDFGSRAVRWNAGSLDPVQLGNLGTDSTGYASNSAFGLNEAGDVVGFAYKYVGGVNLGERAVRWAAGQTTPTELGYFGTTSGGHTDSSAGDINNHGDIVGSVSIYNAGKYVEAHAVIWPAGSTVPIDLNTLIDPSLGLTLESVSAINDAGQIVGAGLYDPNHLYNPADGENAYFRPTRVFILTPVPEPAGVSAFVLFALILRRNRQSICRFISPPAQTHRP